MKKIQNIHILYFLVGFISVVSLYSCDSYVDVGVSSSQLSIDNTYSNDASATSAVLGLYSYTPLRFVMYYSWTSDGLYADELQYPSGSSSTYRELSQSASSTTNSNITVVWWQAYTLNRYANLVIQGVNNSTSLSDSVRTRLLGEAKFFRAYVYFQLVNHFGAVPLALSPTELDNAYLSRSSTDSVWSQVIADLKDAESLLPSKYNTTLRTRANKYAASTLLARAYLYTGDYASAEMEATKVIEATDASYTLPALSSALLNTSSEVILQAATYYSNAYIASAYRTTSSTAVPTYVLYPGFINSFESGDKRKTVWVDSVTSSGTKYYKINKFKYTSSTASVSQYNLLLRLAEVYLIRAEARAQLGIDLAGAQSDLNQVRNRAGLSNTSATTQSALLTAIAQERKVELFGEGHRWLDLKRTNKADALIGELKPTTWKSTAILWPIPTSQIDLNSNLTQNPGYE
jgi:starch-binding outer membrane protein, SusD/RagB family